MNVLRLEETIRDFKFKMPFVPFVIQLTDKRTLMIDDPDAIGFAEGTVGFIDPNGEIVMIPYADVSAVRAASLEAAK